MKNIQWMPYSKPFRFYDSVSTKNLELEIKNAKKILGRNLNSDIQCFAWVEGEKDAYSKSCGLIGKMILNFHL